MAGDRTPNGTSTSRLVLAPEDLDRISAAIRKGLAKEPPDGRKLFREVLAVLVGFALLFLLYLALTNWRPAVAVTAQSNALPATEVLIHKQEGDKVIWTVETGQVRALAVEELQADESNPGVVTIWLPIPAAECGEVAAQLATSCVDGVVEVNASVTVSWNVPHALRRLADAERSTSSAPESETLPLRLTLHRQVGNSAGPSGDTSGDGDEASEATASTQPQPELTIADAHAGSQQWCFTLQESAAATLSITGGSAGYQRVFEPATRNTDCQDGVQVRVTAGAATISAEPDSDSVEPPAGLRRGSVVTLSGISSLNISASSRALDASALTGTLRIGPDVRVFDTPTQALFSAGEPIESRLEVRAGTPSLTIEGEDVTGIVTDQGNLVSTVWQRNPELILPIFLGLVGVLTPLLGAAYRNGVDYLTTRRLPRWPDRREPALDGEPAPDDAPPGRNDDSRDSVRTESSTTAG